MNVRLIVALVLLLIATGCAHVSRETALDRYVATPDANYSWRLVNTVPGQGHTVFLLEMTSQSWLTPQEVDRTLWKHWLTIIKPDQVRHGTGLLFIGGGSNERPVPKEADDNLVRIALATESVVTELRMVPNQPLLFAGETKPLVEDELIAYTWDKYLRTGDDRWPARLPMTKSAVRAMDTVTDFCAGPEAGGVTVTSFVIAGGSKRGWTTWTTAAVDSRVVAIVPIVIDLLNVTPSFIHHWEAYGFYAPAVGDYEAMGIMDWQGTKEYRNLMKIVEPFEYRERFTMPKLILNATGDQFFLPDSSQFYFDELPEPKYLRYVPNGDHSLRETDALETLVGFYHARINDLPMPQLKWKIARDGTLRVETTDRPTSVRLWQANNREARDFRLETIGRAWTSTELSAETEEAYIVRVEPPPEGWTAFLVEATFVYPERPAPIKLSTPVQVVPDVKPFKFQPKPHPK
jgi:PhoPQ-activated pathogenicity-related protein